MQNALWGDISHTASGRRDAREVIISFASRRRDARSGYPDLASRRRDAVGDVDHPNNATAIITKRAFYTVCPGTILGPLITS